MDILLSPYRENRKRMRNEERERNEECEPVASLAKYLASALGPGSGNIFMAPFWNKSFAHRVLVLTFQPVL